MANHDDDREVFEPGCRTAQCRLARAGMRGASLSAAERG